MGAVLLHLRERPRLGGAAGWPPLSGAIWAFVGMARADGVLLFAVSAIFKLYDAVVRVRQAPRERRWRTFGMATLHVVLWVALFAAFYVPYFLWRYEYYDWFFPNTYYAKVGSGADQYDRGIKYVLDFLQESGGWLLLLLPLVIAESAVRRTATAYVLALTGAWLAYTAYVGGDALLRFRFLAPVLPLYYSVIALTAVAIATRLRSAMPRQRWLAEAIASAAVLAAVAVTLHPQAVDAIHMRGERLAVEYRVSIGEWLAENMEDDTAVAAIPVGAIGYESDLVVFDMLGITDEHIAHRKLDIGDLAAGHEKYDTEYILDQEPDIIILIDSLTAIPLGEEAYGSLGGVFIPALTDMLGNERLLEEYERRAVPVEDMWLNLLVRKDARSALAATQPAPP
jgi:hypothetical protein